jgi:hypothetical protein
MKNGVERSQQGVCGMRRMCCKTGQAADFKQDVLIEKLPVETTGRGKKGTC